MKKAKRFVSLLLVAVMTLYLLAGCGDKNRKTEKAQVNYPVPTDTEAVVDAASGLAVNYYLAGRAYLDTFLNYDISTLTEDNYTQYNALVDNAVKAFENADKVNGVLNEALDIYEKEENGEGPKVQKLKGAPSFGMTAYAAEMGSKEWAQSIMDEYAKAKPGYAIRHLASQLGTDAKHAYAQMKMAQDILMGAEYTQIADKANTAVKTATVLKTAGTTAGLVIAVATAPASGALATAVSTGGITMSGVNTVLEIGSTASILYTNGEDNEFSMACDKTESQLAPIGQIFAIAGIGANIKDLAASGKDIWKNGYNSLDAKSKEDLAMNTFGVISYGAGAINDYVNSGSIMSGTFTKGDDGVKFTLMNTLTGTDPEQQKNVKTVLTEAGLPENEIDNALKTAVEGNAAGTQGETGKMNTDTMNPEVSQKIIDNTKPIMDDDFDLDSYLKTLQKILFEIAEMGYEEEYNEETAEATIFIDQICGQYDMDGKYTDEGDQGGGGYVEVSAILTVKPLEKNKVEIYSSVFGSGEEKDGEGEINLKTGELKYNNPDGNPVTITFNITADGVSAVYHAEEEFDVDGEHYKSAIDMKGNKIKE